MSLNLVLHWIEFLLKSLLLFVLWYVGLAILGLLYRFVSIKFGDRVEPSGQKGILITGATSGIGLTLAKHFYKLGFTVFACYYNEQEEGFKELKELSIKPHDEDRKKTSENNARPPSLFLIRMDVRSQVSIENSSKEVNLLLDEHAIELFRLINNAGVSSDGPFEWCGRESMRNVVDTNVIGVMMVTRQFIQRILMCRGRVINVSSGLFLFPSSGISIYGSTKSAIAYFSEGLHADIKKYGASCNCVMPGNLITNSNIIFSRIEGIKESEMKLNELEKKMYSESIQQYKKGVYRYLRIRLETYKDDPEHLAKRYNFTIPNLEKSEVRKNSRSTKLFSRILRTLDGSSVGSTIDQTGVKNGFEDAVCLKNPPRQIFAGGMVYSHLSGPSACLIPIIYHNFLGSLLAISSSN